MGEKILKGRVFKVGDNISTDLLMPSFTMFGKVPQKEIKNYVFHENKPNFIEEVQKGDIILAGKNFGCGSSRPATKNLIALGLSCVVAESFSAIFFRNSIALGFPLFKVEDINNFVKEKELIKVFPQKGYIQAVKNDKKK